MSKEYDLVIVGAGMVGASLALALGDSGLRIALVESVRRGSLRQPSYDDRGIALSLSSRRIFEAMGIWPKLSAVANPIRKVHVSDQGQFGKVRMDADSLRLEALGYVVVARELGNVLLSSLDDYANIDLLCPARVRGLQRQEGSIALELESDLDFQGLRTSLLVAADGTHSLLRQQLGIETEVVDYQQTAIVCNITPQSPHQDTAFERFTPRGPLAILPLAENRAVVVMAVASSDAEYYLGLDDVDWLAEIEKQFGRRLGRLRRPGKRQAYPIIQLQAQAQLAERSVLLGNAAHTIHPNGAQGFNLCLRDVAGLAEQMQQAIEMRLDIGSQAVLETYYFARKSDQDTVSRISHGIGSWFYNRSLPRTLLRNSAMTALDIFAPAKTQLMRRGMGLSGRQPAMVRETGS